MLASLGAAVWGWALVRRQRDALDALHVNAEIEAGRNRDGADLATRLTAGLNALEDGVVVYSVDGEVLRNRSAQRFAGARHGDALIEAGVARLAALALRGTAGSEELELFGPPRMVFLLESEPHSTVNGSVGAVVRIRDISDARRIDEIRRDFVANVSHELRTPVGALGLLAETIADEPDAEVVQQFAERMVREAERLANTIDDLLDLSMIETEEIAGPVPVAVTSVIEDAVLQMSNAAEVAQIPINVGAIADVKVLGDRRQLVSAVYNLLDNAVKYSEAETWVDICAEVHDQSVGIIVRDHGIGIPSRDLERIFERFYRVDRARSRESGGTGLGLSIVRHVAAAHGGSVTVISHEGEGSTFTIAIPVSSEEVHEHHG